MAYIPPHKRHSNSSEKPKPIPESLVPTFKETLNLGPKNSSHRRSNKNSLPGWGIIYAKHSISRWWPIHSTSDVPIPETFRLEPLISDHRDCRTGEKALVLVGDHNPTEVTKDSQRMVKEPWVSIAERISPHIMATLQNLNDELPSVKEVFKPLLVAKFGKVIFYGGSMDAIRKLAATSEADSRKQVRKLFNTSVSKAYVGDIQKRIVPKLGLNSILDKEHYQVKVLDKYLPDSTISCKCVVGEDGKRLQVYKIELNPIRHFLADMSCLDKDLDLRVMLYSKRVLVDLDDEEKDSIDKLINAAVIDKDVKGGLRWPLGKEEVGNRFSVIGVWKTKHTAFKGPTMRLKLRHADRFDFRSSTGEDSNEVSLKMTEISGWLENGTVEEDQLVENLGRTVKLIWDNLLSCEHAAA